MLYQSVQFTEKEKQTLHHLKEAIIDELQKRDLKIAQAIVIKLKNTIYKGPEKILKEWENFKNAHVCAGLTLRDFARNYIDKVERQVYTDLIADFGFDSNAYLTTEVENEHEKD